MKKKMITALFISILSLGAFAQNFNSNKTPGERAKFQTEWMNENLSLSKDQLTAVDSLNLVYANKMESVKEIKGRFNKLKQARDFSQEKEKELQKILNADQFKTWQDKKSELQAKMREISEQNR